MASQSELVDRLLDEMEACGVAIGTDCEHSEAIDVLLVLDSLACAGLRLVEDETGQASAAYFEGVKAVKP